MQARRQIYRQASKPGNRKPRLGNFSQNRGRDWGKRSVSHSCIKRKWHFVRCDASARFNYNWNRYYDPTTAKYITSDPIGLIGGFNSFIYANSNPIINYDSDGLLWGNIARDIIAELGCQALERAFRNARDAWDENATEKYNENVKAIEEAYKLAVKSCNKIRCEEPRNVCLNKAWWDRKNEKDRLKNEFRDNLKRNPYSGSFICVLPSRIPK